MEYFDSLETQTQPTLEKKTIEQIVSELKPMMQIPKETKTVIIFDDEPEIIADILTILQNWENVNVIYCDAKTMENDYEFPIDGDVYLVDENLGEPTSGRMRNFAAGDVPNMLGEVGNNAKIVSISGGEKPNWVKNKDLPHFQNKSGILYGGNAQKFVELMNAVITGSETLSLALDEETYTSYANFSLDFLQRKLDHKNSTLQNYKNRGLETKFVQGEIDELVLVIERRRLEI
jgi:hypothetical protein